MKNFRSALLVFSLASIVSGCSQTDLSGGGSIATGAVGAEDAKKQTVALPKCDAPLGRVELVDKQSPVLAAAGLTSPVPVVQLMIQESGCFQIVDRSLALSGRGKSKGPAIDYFLTPEVLEQNENAGGIAGGAGKFLPGIAGTIASSIDVKTSKAETVISLTDASNGVQILAAKGVASTNDVGVTLERGVRGFGAGAGVYSSTPIGKTTAAAFLDAYIKLVKQVQALPPLKVASAKGSAPSRR